MSRRKPKQPAANLAAMGKSLANSFATGNDRLVYWFDQLCPDWKPEKTGIQVVHDEATQQACAIPTWSTKLDGARRYLVAVLGYSADTVDVMTPAELIEILRREVENREPADDAPPDYLMSRLSKREGQLLTYLWTKPMARINALHASVWSGKAVTDEAIMKVAERLNNKLAEMPDYCHITVKHSGSFIVLDK